jgi:glutamate formiminotransferase
VAAAVRSDHVRALGLAVGERTQVSMNLISPHDVGPMTAFDLVAEAAGTWGLTVDGAELVGLIPARCLADVPRERWAALDLSPEQTIEWQLARRNERRRSR